MFDQVLSDLPLQQLDSTEVRLRSNPPQPGIRDLQLIAQPCQRLFYDPEVPDSDSEFYGIGKHRSTCLQSPKHPIDPRQTPLFSKDFQRLVQPEAVRLAGD